MPKLMDITWMMTIAIAATHAIAAVAQQYPHKSIRVLTSQPGGGSDLAARTIAQGITGNLGQPVIVDNRGSGTLSGSIVAKAPADGYTLLMQTSSLWTGQLISPAKTPFDVLRDFAPITLASIAPTVLVVPPSLPANSVRELIALAKAKPAELNYASGNTGSSAHLAAELFKHMAGVNIVRVNYKGTGQALTDLMGGQVQVMFSVTGAATAQIKAGKLKALAVSGAKPSTMMPGLPTVAASGVPGFEAVSMFSVFAPAKTPNAIIERLNQEIVRVVNRVDVKEKFLGVGVESVGSTPQELGAAIKSEMARLGKMIKEAGIREDE